MKLRWIYATGLLVTVAVPVADIWADIDYRLGANLSLTYLAVLVTAFTALYGVRSRWGVNPIGRTFFTKCVFLSLVLWQAVVSSFLGTDYPYREPIRYVIYTLGVVAYIPMLITLWRQQRDDRSHDWPLVATVERTDQPPV